MYNENEISLTEATVLALQGKLKLEETKPARKRNNRLKKESKQFNHINDVWNYFEQAKNEADLKKRINDIPTGFGIFTYDIINDGKTARITNQYEEYDNISSDTVDIDFQDLLDETKCVKEESVNISTDDVTVSTDEAGNTTVVTDKETVTVTQNTLDTDLPVIDEPIEDETIDVPVEGDETIIPEEEVSEETVEDIIEEPTENSEEDSIENIEDETIENLELDESKNLQEGEIPKGILPDDVQMKIYEMIQYGRNLDNQSKEENIEETFEAIIEEYPELNEEELKDYIEIKANEIYSGEYDENLKLDESKEIKTEDVEEKSLYQEIKESNKGLYDFVANEYYRLSKEDLKEIALDAIYVADKDEEILAEIKDRTELEEGKDCKINETKNGFSSKVKTEAIEDSEETKCEGCKDGKCECDSIEQPIEEAKECLKEEEPEYEWVLQGNYGYGWDDLVTYDNKEEAQEDYKTYREEEPEFAHRIRKRLVKEEAKKLNERILVTNTHDNKTIKTDEDNLDNKEKAQAILNSTSVFKKGDNVAISDYKVVNDNEDKQSELQHSYNLKKESKQTFNKKSFEEALTKFYNFNDERIKSFKIENIASNKKGNLKIEGKLNDKIDVTMIFNKVTEGKSFVSYRLQSTNNILKESKEIKTSMLIAKNNNTLNCRNLISR